MKKIIFLIIFLTFSGCSKPKTVFICGDHVCINKAEAKQYFEDNLTLEVKVIDNNSKKEVDLIELNLKSNENGKKRISLLNKNQTKNKIRVLSNDEIEKKKTEIKKRKKSSKKKNESKKIIKEAKLKIPKDDKKKLEIQTKSNKVVNKKGQNITDICTILEKCSIDEISKYLIKKGKEKKYPNIATQEIR